MEVKCEVLKREINTQRRDNDFNKVLNNDKVLSMEINGKSDKNLICESTVKKEIRTQIAEEDFVRTEDNDGNTEDTGLLTPRNETDHFFSPVKTPDSSSINPVTRRSDLFPIFLREDVEIPARSEAIFMTTRGKLSTSKHIIIEPAEVEVNGVATARIVCRNETTVPVRLINIQNAAVKVKAKTLIGYAYDTEDEVIRKEEEGLNKEAAIRNIDVHAKEEILKQISLDHLNEEVKFKLKELLMEYIDVFRVPNTKLGCTSKVKHRIITEDVMPIAKRPYRIPFGQRKLLDDEMDKMLRDGIIVPSQSPWSFPVVLINKKQHPGEKPEIRICIDYRELNAVTKADYFPLPNLQETIDQLSGAQLFSTMDLASGYYQVELHPDDREKSAFSTPTNHYEFKRMPMGLRNSPATWQRLMFMVLGNLCNDAVLVYLDDIIVYTDNTLENHLEKLRAVFTKLRENNLTLKPTKCKFMQTETHFLGHIISPEGCKTDPEKTRVVQNYPRPKNVKDIRAFLGLCGFYRRFVPKFSEIAQPLSQLTRKDEKFKWTDTQETAFTKLKLALSEPPVLKYPDLKRPFIVTTDASGIAISGILSQKYNGFEHPIAYTSRILNKSERNYSTIERECLAVVYAIKHYRCYLAGTKFTLVTDHAPLRYLLTLKDPSSRLARWSIQLLEYDFDIQHRKGTLNRNADALSRILNEPNTVDIRTLDASHKEDEILEPLLPVMWDDKTIADAQYKDVELRKIIASVKNKTDSQFYLNAEKLLYKTRDNFDRHDKLVIPDIMKNEIMRLFHDTPTAAHSGFKKTLELIKQHFFWKKMTTDIKKYCDTCHSCATHKLGVKTKFTLQNIPVPAAVFDKVAMDIVGPLNRTRNGNKYILTIMDYLSRFPEVIPLPDIHAETVAKAFVTNFITRYGAPRALITDCGTQFVSKLFREMCKLLDIKKLQTTPYRPQANGMIERMHKSMKEMLSHYVTNEKDSWDEWIPYIMMAYRNTIHKSTNETPYFLMYGRDMQLPFPIILNPQPVKYDLDENYNTELMQRLQHAQKTARYYLETRAEKQSNKSAESARNKTYQLGDKVYLHMPVISSKQLARKFQPKWTGPYRIIEVLGPVTYRIKLIQGSKTHIVHVDRLKIYKGNNKSLIRNEQYVSEKNEINNDFDDNETFMVNPPQKLVNLDATLAKPPNFVRDTATSLSDTEELSPQDLPSVSDFTPSDIYESNPPDLPSVNNNPLSDIEEIHPPSDSEEQPPQELVTLSESDNDAPSELPPSPAPVQPPPASGSHTYQTRSKGRAETHPWVLRIAI